MALMVAHRAAAEMETSEPALSPMRA